MAQDFCEAARAARRRIRARYHANVLRLAQTDEQAGSEQAARHARSMIEAQAEFDTAPGMAHVPPLAVAA
eukprot:8269683-Pyramimonas_sp.AAC.1